MTAAAVTTSKLSPWLTVWFRPGDAIERVLAAPPRAVLPVLAGLGTAFAIVAAMAALGLAALLLDWRILTGVIVIGAAAGVPLLYFSAVFFGLTGDVLSGRATQPQMRAALAWGNIPAVAGLAISLAALGGLRVFGPEVSGLQASGAGDPSELLSRAVVPGLQVVSAVCALWAVVAIILMLRRIQRFSLWRAVVNVVFGATMVMILGGIFLGVVAIIPARIFLFQTFNTPSAAMMPTLLAGDYFIVSKYSRESAPVTPSVPFLARLFPAQPARGDVVVFHIARDPTTVYVKRIVGLPGDRIQMVGGEIVINGAPVKRERLADFIDPATGAKVKRWRETLPNGVGYEALDLLDNGYLDNTQVYAVPPGHYFMMGDNLDNSSDSRVLNQFGYVPAENLVGRVAAIFLSVTPTSGADPPTIRYERIGMAVR